MPLLMAYLFSTRGWQFLENLRQNLIKWKSDITLKQPAVWRLFPCFVAPKLLDEHQEAKYKERKPKQESPRDAVKGDCQGVERSNLLWLLALHLKFVQVHPGKVLDQVVPVRHNCCLPNTNLTLFCLNLYQRKDKIRIVSLHFKVCNVCHTYVSPCMWHA